MGPLGELRDGQAAVIIGGGPAGVSCALTIQRLSQEMGRSVSVFLYEGKRFGAFVPQHNQCVGVLSPPIAQIVEEGLHVPFPWHLVQRTIGSYVLHSDHVSVHLEGPGEPSYAVRRVQFDDYLLEQAEARGIRVIRSRVADIEVHAEKVMIYSDSDSRAADVVVGAFGLDDGSCRLFERATPYRPPHSLSSIVTKIHPCSAFMERFGGSIHAFLPSLQAVEFGAVTPKGNHLTINIAGSNVNSEWMDRFLALPAVRSILPGADERRPSESRQGISDLEYFKGRFPVSVAAGLYGDRYLLIGDAAGLIRPFKGKGVTAGCLSGIAAGKAVMTTGVSRAALEAFFAADPYSREVRADMWYARAVRRASALSSRLGFLDAVLTLAEREPRLKAALFNSVSAHKPYRDIVWETVTPSLTVEVLRATLGAVGSRTLAMVTRAAH